MLTELKDVQSQPDFRRIEIDKVGIKDIRYPITVLDRGQGTQQTVASINMYVDLPHHFKGTHMSRFVEILNEYRREINIKNIDRILREMRERLSAKVAHIEIAFPYFIEKMAPVTKTPGLMEYFCCIYGSSGEHWRDLVLEVHVPVTTVCPCSLEISCQGAHNQRGIVRVRIRFKRFFWIEDLVEIVEDCASCEVYSVLKRPDEKFVTEKAFRRPMFVEDVVRAVCERLMEHPEITWFSVEAENFESIHNHSAYAFIERRKTPPKSENGP
ncbi:GTP cyclohydrolase I [Thermosulfuriphilus ammonigenes]|nr:GTP cyclohydrolase FolE2 [Thermosulfuriphilus ammonigenes]MBA2848268.1 GTP cyclohydrolase I [Thermosulfuriphilus ammonigenes]